ncbi:MAG: hypothetical protein HN712_15445 [Gemmatimonadetes bacterium]|jgi:HEAT repeat protein|nr:hypothetical protein [Gemmatimonadota bacterium]MBT7861716.1 hypothetical protein [Gemmatimonadota bacterium]
MQSWSEGWCQVFKHLREQAHAAGVLSLLFLAACEPSAETLVDRLGDPEARSLARQELLLAKEHAVEPLLAAMEDPGHADSRPELVEVLASLTMRVDDPRIMASLARHLADDPDPEVRERIAHIARRLGFKDFAGPLLDAVADDESSQVRYEAIMGLSALADGLSAVDEQRLREVVRHLVKDSHQGLRDEAIMVLEEQVTAQLREAHTSQLQAETTRAESLYHQAILTYPDSRHAHYRFARYQMDLGDHHEGLATLREHGMLLDVPRLSTPPSLDGRLDEPVWREAASGGSFSQFASVHKANFPSEVETDLYVGYTDQALYLGFVGHDAHPDSIQAGDHEEDGSIWWEDIVEVYVDANFDHRSYLQVGVNSKGVTSDFWYPNGLRGEGQDQDWDADMTVGARIGDGHWALELELRWQPHQMPRPQPGDLWGFNFVRVYRGSEFSQWVRTYGSEAHTPDDFGLLLFK